MSSVQAVVLYSHKPKNSPKNEISVDEKEVVKILQTIGNGFTKILTLRGTIGLVPTQCLKIISNRPTTPDVPPPQTTPPLSDVDKTESIPENSLHVIPIDKNAKPVIPKFTSIDFKRLHRRTPSSPCISPRGGEQGIFKSPRGTTDVKTNLFSSPHSPISKSFYISTPVVMENYIRGDSPISDVDLDIKITALCDELEMDVKIRPNIMNLTREQKLKMLDSHERLKRPKAESVDNSPRQKTPRSIQISNPKLIEVKNEKLQQMDEAELDKLFDDVLEQMGIDSLNRPTMRNLPRNQKQMMIEMHQEKMKIQREVNESTVRQIIGELSKPKISPEIMKNLVVLLEYADHEWIVDFIQWGGVGLIASHLAQTNLLSSSKPHFTEYVGKILGLSKNRDDPMQLYCIEAFYYLINDNSGMAAFIEEKDAIRSFVLVFDAAGMKTKANIAFLLAVISKYSTEGATLVAEAFSYYKLVKREPYRFYDLVNSLSEINFDLGICQG
jgi:hypothetical protein